MKIKGLFTIFATVAALAFAAGCSTEEEFGPERTVVDQNDIVFEVSVASESYDRVTVDVSHNGGDRETYCVFCYNDVDTPVEDAINRKVAELTNSEKGLASALTNGNNHVSVIADLDDESQYRFVVFGLNSDGTTYGTPATADFTTTKAPLIFTVTVSEIEERSAVASVVSTGDESDTWHLFWTTDIESPVEELIDAEMEKLAGNYAGQLHTENDEIEITGLTAGTEYRAVVFGIDTEVEEGEETVVGTAGNVIFGTVPVFGENQEWKVEYKGKEIDAETNAVLETISVTVPEGTRWAYVSTTRDVFRTDFKSSYQTLIETYVNDLTENYGIEIWQEEELTVLGSDDILNTVFEDDTYVIAVFEISVNGNMSGNYATVEFTADMLDFEGSDDYKSWVGYWRIEDENEVGFDITILPYVTDAVYAGGTEGTAEGDEEEEVTAPVPQYLMYGWEAESGLGEIAPVTLAYDSETKELVFLPAENITMVTLSDGLSASICFGGSGGQYLFTPDILAVAKASGAGAAQVTIGDEAAGKQGMETMQYYGAAGGSLYVFSDPETLPVFPMTMSKMSEAGTTGLAGMDTPAYAGHPVLKATGTKTLSAR